MYSGLRTAGMLEDGVGSGWPKGGKWTKKLITAFIGTVSVPSWTEDAGVSSSHWENQLQIIIAFVLNPASAASGHRASVSSY